jgi:hypothetical protein
MQPRPHRSDIGLTLDSRRRCRVAIQIKAIKKMTVPGRDCGSVSQRARQGGSHSTCIARVSQTSRTPVNLFESASSYTEEK